MSFVGVDGWLVQPPCRPASGEGRSSNHGSRLPSGRYDGGVKGRFSADSVVSLAYSSTRSGVPDSIWIRPRPSLAPGAFSCLAISLRFALSVTENVVCRRADVVRPAVRPLPHSHWSKLVPLADDGRFRSKRTRGARRPGLNRMGERDRSRPRKPPASPPAPSGAAMPPMGGPVTTGFEEICPCSVRQRSPPPLPPPP